MKAGRLVFAAVALFAIHDDADMQLVLLDETVFTIGANTDLTVDEVNLAGTFSVNIVVDLAVSFSALVAVSTLYRSTFQGVSLTRPTSIKEII